jgi:hypothetical protein
LSATAAMWHVLRLLAVNSGSLRSQGKAGKPKEQITPGGDSLTFGCLWVWVVLYEYLLPMLHWPRLAGGGIIQSIVPTFGWVLLGSGESNRGWGFGSLHLQLVYRCSLPSVYYNNQDIHCIPGIYFNYPYFGWQHSVKHTDERVPNVCYAAVQRLSWPRCSRQKVAALELASAGAMEGLYRCAHPCWGETWTLLQLRACRPC